MTVAGHRHERIAGEMQQEIGAMLTKGLKDPRIGLVTVTGVDLSPDLRHARAWVSVWGTDKDKEESLEALNHAAGWIRHELGQRIRMKFLPDLVFKTDTSLERGERIDKLLDSIKDDL